MRRIQWNCFIGSLFIKQVQKPNKKIQLPWLFPVCGTTSAAWRAVRNLFYCSLSASKSITEGLRQSGTKSTTCTSHTQNQVSFKLDIEIYLLLHTPSRIVLFCACTFNACYSSKLHLHIQYFQNGKPLDNLSCIAEKTRFPFHWDEIAGSGLVKSTWIHAGRSV